MDTPILKVSNLSKSIKKKEIIKNISFQLKKGEVLGFLGANGAGKSTTLRMLVGLSRPSAGTISICGHSIRDDYVKAMSHVGCIIEGPDLYDYLSGYKNLELLGAMSKHVTKEAIDHAVALVGMSSRIHDKVRIYSMGMKQRIGLAQALIHQPDLLILDEPTNGLDPQGIHEFREIIQSLAKEAGISVLISSHLISEIQLMCDRVCIINHGIIVRDDAVTDLLSSNEIVWALNNPSQGQKILSEHFKLDSQITDQNELVAAIDPDVLPKINELFVTSGLELQTVATKKSTLEALFLSLTNQQTIQ
ncbi:ABC transporter ATP-binding protein [Acetobacterium woodii]|uniref:ABC transport system ATPase component n=1 Tax=Acetobacterium woodii (strain ATCC 29683 / DSM 1030 / JCM 2381 / KCTC 1655 / WB1) TaxID=931626 RepID=H6LIB1_ACEWD|nr:ABC transporter ATP-binding protein [Acetobacterium woodii]AFA47285.1 ABC transport system ATPase component [Acetobacterium woodii DSM 1030]